MSIKKLIRISAGAEVDRVTAPIMDVLDEVTDKAILDGQVLQNIELPSGSTVKINHGLNRAIQGWLICDITGASTAGFIQRVAGADTKRQLWLQANSYGATVTVSIYVF